MRIKNQNFVFSKQLFLILQMSTYLKNTQINTYGITNSVNNSILFNIISKIKPVRYLALRNLVQVHVSRFRFKTRQLDRFDFIIINEFLKGN